MGMDLITTIVAHDKDTTLDWEAGFSIIPTLTEDDVDLDYMENFVYGIEVDDEGVVIMSSVYEFIKDALTGLKLSLESHGRNRNDWNMFGRRLYIFGEESFGDVSEIHDEVGILYAAPKVLEAVGFLTSFE